MYMYMSMFYNSKTQLTAHTASTYTHGLTRDVQPSRSTQHGSASAERPGFHPTSGPRSIRDCQRSLWRYCASATLHPRHRANAILHWSGPGIPLPTRACEMVPGDARARGLEG